MVKNDEKWDGAINHLSVFSSDILFSSFLCFLKFVSASPWHGSAQVRHGIPRRTAELRRRRVLGVWSKILGEVGGGGGGGNDVHQRNCIIIRWILSLFSTTCLPSVMGEIIPSLRVAVTPASPTQELIACTLRRQSSHIILYGVVERLNRTRKKKSVVLGLTEDPRKSPRENQLRKMSPKKSWNQHGITKGRRALEQTRN